MVLVFQFVTEARDGKGNHLGEFVSARNELQSADNFEWFVDNKRRDGGAQASTGDQVDGSA